MAYLAVSSRRQLPPAGPASHSSFKRAVSSVGGLERALCLSLPQFPKFPKLALSLAPLSRYSLFSFNAGSLTFVAGRKQGSGEMAGQTVLFVREIAL